LIQGSSIQVEFSDDGGRLIFHLPNGNSYTISPTDSSPEHFWGTIYSAEWHHAKLMKSCTCAIKASDFILQTSDGEDPRKEYRRPRLHFEREVRTFQNTKHHNVLQMYDFWEWEGRGYIAMEKLKGSLGDILYEAEYFDLLQRIRRDKTILAELVRQVFL
jgi:serine/threonine protein kinase